MLLSYNNGQMIAKKYNLGPFMIQSKNNNYFPCPLRPQIAYDVYREFKR